VAVPTGSAALVDLPVTVGPAPGVLLRVEVGPVRVDVEDPQRGSVVARADGEPDNTI
jgi:hypothetical protein